jgi:CDP-paratose 2-epimerase
VAEKWLITGGCGFVGSNLAASLLEDGIEVVAVDNLSRLGSSENLAWLRAKAERSGAGRFTFLSADTRSRTDIEEVFERHGKALTAVAHVAGQVAMTTSLERPRYDFEVNVLGAINLLEGIRKHARQAVALFSSTNKVYGDLEQLRYAETDTRWTCPDFPDGFDESLPLSFQSPYGCSKGAADQYFLDYHRMYELKTIVFRHSSMYGGRQFATYDQGWVGWFCQEVLRQLSEAKAGLEVRPFTISGDGKQVRDLLHADDLVACYRGAATNDSAIGRAFNIGGGQENSLSLLELFAELKVLLGVSAEYRKLERRQSDQRLFVADCADASARFAWRPRVSARDGLERMLEWTRGIAGRRGST